MYPTVCILIVKIHVIIRSPVTDVLSFDYITSHDGVSVFLIINTLDQNDSFQIPILQIQEYQKVFFRYAPVDP